MNIGNIISNCNGTKKRLKQSVDNYIVLVLSAFHRVQKAFNAILSKYDSNKSFNSPTHALPESQISSFNVFKSNKVHFRKINLKFQVSERIHIFKSDGQKGTRRSILERSICLEMNETEFLTEGNE